MRPEDMQPQPDEMPPFDPLAYHRERYAGLKMIVTAMLAHYHDTFSLVVENHPYQALESEFNNLADLLGLEAADDILIEMDERKQRDAQNPARWN